MDDQDGNHLLKAQQVDQSASGTAQTVFPRVLQGIQGPHFVSGYPGKGMNH